MGYNSTIIVLNDGLGDIASDPNYGTNLANAIGRYRFGEDPIDVGARNFINASSVIETHHANGTAIVAIGGNYGSVLGYVNVETHHKDEDKLEILRQLADAQGFRLVRKATKKRK